MRVLLDTHAFLWLLAGDTRLPARTRGTIAAARDVALSAASVWEAELKRAAGRLDAPPVRRAALRAGFRLLDVTAEHATHAAALPLYHRDPFDRMLIAQAELDARVLVTKDEHIRRYAVPTAW